jgi:hypothetical protein
MTATLPPLTRPSVTRGDDVIPQKDRSALLAFFALLLAICYLATVAAVLAFHRRYVEALGFGGAVTGLIGVMGTFRPRAPQPGASDDMQQPPPATTRQEVSQ